MTEGPAPASTTSGSGTMTSAATATSAGATSAGATADASATIGALFDHLPELVVLIDAGGVVRLVNQRLLDTMGYARDEVVGSNIFDYVHPDDLAYMAWSWENREANPGETGILVHARGRNADGSWRAVEILGLSLLDHPDIGGMVMTMRDLSRETGGVADSPARLRSMIDRTTDVVLLLDAQGTIHYANRRLTSGYGHDQDRIVGSPFTAILHPADATDAQGWLQDLVASGDRATARIRLRIQDPEGQPHDVEWHGTNQLVDPLIGGVILSGRDITDLVAMEAQVREQTAQLLHSADHDVLTGLLNRRAFTDRVRQHLVERRAHGDDREVVVLFCDLDRFKAVNDTYGHDIGDEVLSVVAHRLRACLREDDVVARYGGDEFTVLLAQDAPPAMVTGLMARLQARIAEPISCGDVVTDVGVTVGVSRALLGDASVELLLRAADQSMYEKKRARR